MTSLIAVVLVCLPEPPRDATWTAGPLELVQTMLPRGPQLELRRKGTALWKTGADPVQNVLIRDDGKFVSAVDNLHEERVRVFGPDGKLKTYEPMTLVTEEEAAAISQTSCGRAWFGGQRFEAGKLVVSVNQAPILPPIYKPPDTPKLEILIDVESGAMARRSPAAVALTVAAHIAQFKTEPARRSELFSALEQKARLPTTSTDPELRDFARAQLSTLTEPGEQEIALNILSAAPRPEDRAFVAAEALERKWPVTATMNILSRDESPAADAWFRAVVEQHLGGVNERSEALRRVVKSRHPDALKLVKLGLADDERYVRDAAAQAMRDLPANNETFDLVAEQATSSADPGIARTALVELFLKNPRFEARCEEKLREVWPGCSVWTAGLADVRGDLSKAKQRYEWALAHIQLPKNGWFADAEAWTNAHVRLARLEPKKAAPHVKALVEHPDFARSDCSNGLPRQLIGNDKCSGLAFDFLIKELKGEKWR
jgi:hypothetical protein